MNINAYIDEIKLKLTGGVLDLEITDEAISKTIYSAMREVQRYIDTTRTITIPYSSCIDLTSYNVSSVSRVYRAEGYFAEDGTGIGTSPGDPVYMAQIQMLSGNGTINGLTEFTSNYAAWNTALQIRNTVSTDLAFRYDKSSEKLYINIAFDTPPRITIEYIPVYKDVDEITSDFWIDVILNLSTGLVQIMLGRIRSRFVQSNALWTMDGETMLAEGNKLVDETREKLRQYAQLTYGID